MRAAVCSSTARAAGCGGSITTTTTATATSCTISSSSSRSDRSVAARATGERGGQAAGGGGADVVKKARTKLGYKDRWHRDNVETRQVSWQQPLAPDARVAVIGGGIAGLSCAQRLARAGMQAVVFDTGEHGVGGRAATRATDDASLRPAAGSSSQQQPPAGLVFDHAAQCFTATDASFQQQCAAWEAAGVIQRWDGPLGVLRPGGSYAPLPAGSSSSSSETEAAQAPYVAVGGMRRLAEHMAQQLLAPSSAQHPPAAAGAVEVVRPMWVGRMVAAQDAGGWRLTGPGNKDLGVFGAVALAHNGKCLNRLVGPTGAPGIARQVNRLRLSAVWVLMAAFEAPLELPGGLQGACVEGSPALAWVANNTAKLRPHAQQQQQPSSPAAYCYTLISTAAFGKANKVPQERVPPEVAAKVTDELLDALRQHAGLPRLPRAVFTRAQLWGAALPLNSPRVPCLLDPASRVGVAGDWLLGASIQAAWLSGQALGERLAALRGLEAEAAASLAMGLDAPFQPLTAASDALGEGLGQGAPGAPRQTQQQRQQAKRVAAVAGQTRMTE